MSSFDYDKIDYVTLTMSSVIKRVRNAFDYMKKVTLDTRGVVSKLEQVDGT